ncbi:DCC1-like thiol-disulfide oxidoreductase family protein [Streptomyces niveiscabiei]|uniref:thiol-disulfide oxidoreductase DCC family protein n=1 Tax=Streptomyces niveiscabiei TaxID=164115 RepID=UPI0029BE1267|nr:DCC1-like thiol-disulfide oxidoreductase family protein [Streptomyces niveiscabiei]MDX3387933.1 DCC1-like thiol-disulfide oxidoreductase family protein [Streptomyces niveiscabiei]
MPVLVYDGDCGFCQVAVDRMRGPASPVIEAVPWQFLDAELTAPHLQRLDREVLLMRGGVVLAGGAEALGRYVGSSPSAGWRVVGAVVRLPGVRGCARVAYGWVARNRRRLPGGTGACAVRGGGGKS